MVGVLLRERDEASAEDSKSNSRLANISAPVLSSFLSDVDARSSFRGRRFRSRHNVPQAGHTLPYDISCQSISFDTGIGSSRGGNTRRTFEN